MTVYDVGGDDDSPAPDQSQVLPIRVTWRDAPGSDQVYVFKDVAELRAHVAVLARLNETRTRDKEESKVSGPTLSPVTAAQVQRRCRHRATLCYRAAPCRLPI